MKTRAEILKADTEEFTENELKEMFSEGKIFTGLNYAKMFGDNLKSCLRRKNISRKELAMRLDISPVAVGMYINGQSEPSLEKLFKIAEFLKVSVTELIGDTEYNSVTLSNNEMIFESRFQRALTLVNAMGFIVESQLDLKTLEEYFLLSKNTIFRHVEKNGEVILVPGTTVYKIKNKKNFVDIFETSEEEAIRQHRPFKAVFKSKLTDR